MYRLVNRAKFISQQFQRAERRKNIVLIGGGHANCLVLKELADKVRDKAKITLISENSYSFYSGMLPGCISGFYNPDEITLFLEPISRYFGIDYIFNPVTKIRPDKKEILLQDG